MMNQEYRRGDVWICDISGAVGSEQAGTCRPCAVISNNIGNRFSPTVIVAVFSTSETKAKIPTHVEIKARKGGLIKDSVLLVEQIKTLDKWNLIDKVGTLNKQEMDAVDAAIDVSLGRMTRSFAMN